VDVWINMAENRAGPTTLV